MTQRILLKSNLCNSKLSTDLEQACINNNIVLDTTIDEVMNNRDYIDQYNVRCVPSLLGIHTDGTKLIEAITVTEVSTFETDLATAITNHTTV